MFFLKLTPQVHKHPHDWSHLLPPLRPPDDTQRERETDHRVATERETPTTKTSELAAAMTALIADT